LWDSRQVYPKGQAGPDNHRPDKWTSTVVLRKAVRYLTPSSCIEFSSVSAAFY